MVCSISSLISRYQTRFESELKNIIKAFGPKTVLRDAIEYALTNGGKRFRPAIVSIVAEAIGKRLDVTDAALAVEFFHTASLIADDLPCMDDDDERRSHPTLHIAFDEATALLATYGLIAAGYDRIRLNGQKLKEAHIEEADRICLLAIENVSYNTGIFGASGGQYLDLFSKDQTETTLLEAIDKKTGTLFEISFVLGWLFGGGESSHLASVKKASRHFGRVFQICDDFLDMEQDALQGNMSFPALVGIERSFELFHEELFELKRELKKLQLESPELMALVQDVENKASNVQSLIVQP